MSDHTAGGGGISVFTRDDDRRLAARIKRQRTSRGWKQRELSRRAGISADRISRLERGAPIRSGELVGLSRAFGLGIDELMLGAPAGSRDELDQLAREMRNLLPPEDLPALIRLLRTLVAGSRSRRETDSKGELK